MFGRQSKFTRYENKQEKVTPDWGGSGGRNSQQQRLRMARNDGILKTRTLN